MSLLHKSKKSISQNQNTLTYLLGEKSPIISLAPEEQDMMTNVTVTQHLIGTLVFYGQTGHFEPFLAESWKESDSGKEINFQLRPDIIAEDGTRLQPRHSKVQ